MLPSRHPASPCNTPPHPAGQTGPAAAPNAPKRRFNLRPDAPVFTPLAAMPSSSDLLTTPVTNRSELGSVARLTQAPQPGSDGASGPPVRVPLTACSASLSSSASTPFAANPSWQGTLLRPPLPLPHFVDSMLQNGSPAWRALHDAASFPSPLTQVDTSPREPAASLSTIQQRSAVSGQAHFYFSGSDASAAPMEASQQACFASPVKTSIALNFESKNELGVTPAKGLAWLDMNSPLPLEILARLPDAHTTYADHLVADAVNLPAEDMTQHFSDGMALCGPMSLGDISARFDAFVKIVALYPKDVQSQLVQAYTLASGGSDMVAAVALSFQRILLKQEPGLRKEAMAGFSRAVQPDKRTLYTFG